MHNKKCKKWSTCRTSWILDHMAITWQNLDHVLWSYYMMAAIVEGKKGYDHQFVEPPPDDLLCLICLCVARDPQQINCCGKVLCKVCLEEHKQHSDYCPQCRKPIKSFADKRSKFFCSSKSPGKELYDTWLSHIMHRWERHPFAQSSVWQCLQWLWVGWGAVFTGWTLS